MNAREMFEACGYKVYANSDKQICYTADERDQYKRVKFKLKPRKLTVHSDVTMALLKAIIAQCRELGWDI